VRDCGKLSIELTAPPVTAAARTLTGVERQLEIPRACLKSLTAWMTSASVTADMNGVSPLPSAARVCSDE